MAQVLVAKFCDHLPLYRQVQILACQGIHLDRATLAGWVAGIYLRYLDAAQSLPECWLWHPEVVEELLWLHTAWLHAYRPAATLANSLMP